MSGHKPWNEISEKLRADPERRARIEQCEQTIEAELTISQLFFDMDGDDTDTPVENHTTPLLESASIVDSSEE